MTQMNSFPGLGALTTIGPPRMLKNSYPRRTDGSTPCAIRQATKGSSDGRSRRETFSWATWEREICKGLMSPMSPEPNSPNQIMQVASRSFSLEPMSLLMLPWQYQFTKLGFFRQWWLEFHQQRIPATHTYADIDYSLWVWNDDRRLRSHLFRITHDLLWMDQKDMWCRSPWTSPKTSSMSDRRAWSILVLNHPPAVAGLLREWRKSSKSQPLK